jgi:hypothetical protein
MKNLSIVLIIGLLLGLSGCAGGLTGSKSAFAPKFRVQNARATEASLQVKTSGGNTININNVMPGTTSLYQEVTSGRVDVTVMIKGESNNPYSGSFFAVGNQTFTVTIANTMPPTVTVVSP